MNPEEKTKKRRLLFNRILGIIFAFSIILVLLFYYFGLVDSWIFAVSVVVLSGVIFTINAGIVETKRTSIWTKVNIFASTIMFLFGITLLAYGLISGNLILF